MVHFFSHLTVVSRLLTTFYHGLVDTLRKLPPDDRLAPQMDNILSLKNPTLKQVDHALTRFCGGGSPPFPFKSADDYCECAWSNLFRLFVLISHDRRLGIQSSSYQFHSSAIPRHQRR